MRENRMVCIKMQYKFCVQVFNRDENMKCLQDEMDSLKEQMCNKSDQVAALCQETADLKKQKNLANKEVKARKQMEIHRLEIVISESINVNC